MKTSIYLLTVLLAPTAANAYTYTRVTASLDVDAETSTGSMALAGINGGPTGAIKSHKIYLPAGIALGSSVAVSPSNAFSSFSRVETDERDGKLTINVPGESSGSRSNIVYDLVSGDLQERPTTITWVGDATSTKPYIIVSCDAPTTISSKEFHPYGYNGSISAATVFIDRAGTGHQMTLYYNCFSSYKATADVEIKLRDETMSLTGASGTAQHGENSLWIKSDPGQIRITINNRNDNDIRVSFDKDKNKPQITQSITSTSEMSLPIYVSTLNTSAGIRSYTVNIDATFI